MSGDDKDNTNLAVSFLQVFIISLRTSSNPQNKDKAASFQRQEEVLFFIFRLEMEKTPRYVRWGYEVNASSDGCIDAIDSYFHQVPLFI